MKQHTRLSSSVKRPLITIATVSLVLLTVNQAAARPEGHSGHQHPMTVISAKDLAQINVNNPEQVKTQLQQLIKNNPKMRRLASKGPGCIALAIQERGGRWSCIKSCVGEVGVSPLQLIGCGVACATAGTGIGALACAVCIGVSVTVIQTCALGCAIWGWAEIATEESQAWNTRRPAFPPGSAQEKLRGNAINSAVR